MKSENILSLTSKSGKPYLTIGNSLFGTTFENKSIFLRLKNEEDILKIPMLFAQFLSKYGIETEIKVEDSNE